ncbi:hypothetical protein E2C01_069278 [Portunus trituberculatus]|uniref:Uncharacterized protein n=1 Tax=Portunus trituberculatus TaxID=210409 RepID=A0A5B7I1R4_PORTR|nr:hypothetical protein [Portunus trituberculatus]
MNSGLRCFSRQVNSASKVYDVGKNDDSILGLPQCEIQELVSLNYSVYGIPAPLKPKIFLSCAFK